MISTKIDLSTRATSCSGPPRRVKRIPARVIAICMTAAVSIVAHYALADPVAADVSIRDPSPPVGSHVLPDKVKVQAASIPLNLRYGEMTAAQKAALKGQYEPMAEGDEPPFPSEGLRPIVDAVMKANAKLLVEGPVELIVDVDANGDATAVSVLRSSSPKMVDFAAHILMLTKYKPAFCSGQPCRMQYPLNFNFTVKNR